MTADQLELPLAPLVIPDRAPTRFERWQAFSAANPQVEEMLVRYAREVLAQGHRRVSLRMLWERVRFEFASQLRGDDVAALNNDHAPFYARSLMVKYDDLKGVFETRTSARALLGERPGAWA